MLRRPTWLPLFVVAIAVAVLAGPPAVARLAGQSQAIPAPASLAPYVPTPEDVVDRMLQLAKVTKNDVV